MKARISVQLSPKNIHVKLLLLVFLLSNNSLVSVDSKIALSRFLPHIQERWEQYVLYFFHPKGINYSDFVWDSSFKTRLAIITNNTGLDSGTYRYSNTLNIVFSSLEIGDELNSVNKTLLAFSEVLVPSKSVFIFTRKKLTGIVHGKDFSFAQWHYTLPIFPALKLLLDVPANSKDSPGKFKIIPICSGYCSSLSTSLAKFEQNLLTSGPASIHRSLFWNANRKTVPGLAWDGYKWIRDTPKEKQHACLTPQTLLDYRCRADLMSLLLLFATHNFTIDLQRKSSKSPVTMDARKPFVGWEVVVVPTASFSRTLSISTSRVTFFEFDSHGLLYCPKLKGEKQPYLGLSAWYEPFNSDIWAMTIAIMLYGFVCSLHYRNITKIGIKILTYVSGVLGQGSSSEIKNFVTFYALIYLMSLYGNGLTSITTVRSTPTAIKTVKELLSKQYKIIYNPDKLNQIVHEIFNDDFKILGISGRLFEHFSPRNLSSQDDTVASFAEANSKVAYMAYTSTITFLKADVGQIIKTTSNIEIDTAAGNYYGKE
ncbi:unnamed protein product [Orchesella dallaii]|uniref:Uncharacterized protein n=1 Tax=Orchesella dallaii TaxID=48710 RepID=A0ABP1R7S3_9HEXA